MFDLQWIVAGLVVTALTVYVVLAGADFGGGVWDALAFLPRAAERRTAIAAAMGPVWEANHVWLILVLVTLFTAFPIAFAAISTALFIPITFAVLGIVLRGAAFTFRAHAASVVGAQRSLGAVFGAASIITPFLLGTVVGGLASGTIRVGANGTVTTDYLSPWLSAFPVLVGLMALALCAFLAAVFLTVETRGVVQEDFRWRGIAAGGAVALFATLALPVTVNGAPLLWQQMLWGRATPLIGGTIVLSLVAMGGLWLRRYRLARIAAVGEVVCIVWGWALAQAPYLIVPDVTIIAAAAPAVTLTALLVVLGVGSLFLLPALLLLFAVFKGRNPAAALDAEG